MKNYLVEKLIEIIGEEDRGIIFDLTADEERKIRELIDIDLYDQVYELRILRDYLVLTLNNIIKEDKDKIKSYHTCITVITSLIDNKIFELGGEV